jgi:hypothetical protein
MFKIKMFKIKKEEEEEDLKDKILKDLKSSYLLDRSLLFLSRS